MTHWWEEDLDGALSRVGELEEACNAYERRIAVLNSLLEKKEEERATLFAETVQLRNSIIRARRVLGEEAL